MKLMNTTDISNFESQAQYLFGSRLLFTNMYKKDRKIDQRMVQWNLSIADIHYSGTSLWQRPLFGTNNQFSIEIYLSIADTFLGNQWCPLHRAPTLVPNRIDFLPSIKVCFLLSTNKM